MPLLMTYEPSGRIHPAGLFGLPLLAALSSAVPAYYYVLAAWYCPVLPRPLLTVGWGLATAFFAGLGVYGFNARGPKLAMILALAGSLVGYALSWVFWSYLVLNLTDLISASGGRRALPLTPGWVEVDEIIRLAENPGQIIQAASAVYNQGLWEIFSSGRKFSGPYLNVIWFLEAAIYFMIVALASQARAGRPFSETGGFWLTRHDLPGAAGLPEGSEVVIDRIRNGDVNYLGVAPVEKKNLKSSYLILELFTPEKPDEWAFVTVTYIKIRKKGRLEPEKLIQHLAIRPRMAEVVRSRFGPASSQKNI